MKLLASHRLNGSSAPVPVNPGLPSPPHPLWFSALPAKLIYARLSSEHQLHQEPFAAAWSAGFYCFARWLRPMCKTLHPTINS